MMMMMGVFLRGAKCEIKVNQSLLNLWTGYCTDISVAHGFPTAISLYFCFPRPIVRNLLDIKLRCTYKLFVFWWKRTDKESAKISSVKNFHWRHFASFGAAARVFFIGACDSVGLTEHRLFATAKFDKKDSVSGETPTQHNNNAIVR